MNIQDLEPNLLSMANAINTALKKYDLFKDKSLNTDNIVVVNFREPSYRKRLALYDLTTASVSSFHHVAHGSGSSGKMDASRAIRFSNTPDSHMSSLGAIRTAETYEGKYGYSCRLDGLEEGINNNIRRRSIVIHPAPYVSNEFILQNGRCGNTWGCFGIDTAISKDLINKIKNGCFLYSYY